MGGGGLEVSTSKLDIWITGEGDPCGVSSQPFDYPAPWVVAVWECSGKLLSWGGRDYFGLPTKGGHLLIDVPPGKYIVRAAAGQWKSGAGIVYGNDWTDHGVAAVCCGETECVTLYAPSIHQCGAGFLHALESLGAVAHEHDIRAAIQAVQKVLQAIKPENRTQFDLVSQPEMQRLHEVAKRPNSDRDAG